MVLGVFIINESEVVKSIENEKLRGWKRAHGGICQLAHHSSLFALLHVRAWVPPLFSASLSSFMFFLGLSTFS